MKKKYIKPEIKVNSLVVDSLMEVISLPTTGHVDNPGFGQAKGYDDLIDDEDSIVFESIHVLSTMRGKRENRN